ncbi:MAG: site-specific integrase [Bdellovibrionales bacterium]|nr:site-specific integrase [Bdellovibrionales bacterium]
MEWIKNRISNKLRKAYEGSSYQPKSPHDCRHTFCTNMVALTEDIIFLQKYVLGHSDSKTTEGLYAFVGTNSATGCSRRTS